MLFQEAVAVGALRHAGDADKAGTTKRLARLG